MTSPDRNARPRPDWRIAGLVLGAVASVALASPELRFVNRETILVHVRPMTASPIEPPPGGRFTMRVDPNGIGETEIRLRWPVDGAETLVSLRAIARPPRPGAEHVLRLDADVQLPGDRTSRTQREIVFDETATALFEVARDGGRPLTLAVETEVVRERTVVTLPSVGAPVQFVLEIEWVEGAHSVPLESNRLHTFVGESVGYGFKLGSQPEAEALQVTLTPTRLYGDLVRIQMEISGKMPDGDELRLLSRREDWLASRDSSSSVDVVNGEPPSGFRFVVTARF